MANNRGFGAYVELHVKKTNAKALGDEIQAAVDQVRKIDIGGRFKVTHASLASLYTQINDRLRAQDFSINLRINHIDAREAIAHVRSQLETMLRDLDLNRDTPNNNNNGNDNNNGGDGEPTLAQLREQQRLLGQIAELQRQLNEFRMSNPQFNAAEAETLETQLIALQNAVESENAANRNAMAEHALHYEENRTQLRQWREELSGVALAEQQVGELSQEQANRANQAANQVQRLQSTLNSIQTTASKLHGDAGTGFLNRVEALRPEVQALEAQFRHFATTGEGDIDELIARFLELSQRVNQVSIDLGQSKMNDPSMGDAAAKAAAQQLNLISRIDSKIAEVQKLISNNTRLAGTATGDVLRQIENNLIELRGVAENTTDTSRAGVDRLNRALSSESERIAQVRVQMIRAGQAGNTLLTRFKNGISKFGGWTIVTRALTAIIRLTKQLVTNVKEIDAAMGQLQIVTQSSAADMEQYANSIDNVASKTGASITELVDATTTYARLGYSLKESTNLAEFTSMLSRVGDIDAGDAQSAITAITKAFTDVDAEKIESVMDKLVTVGNNFPISTAEIAEGMNNASSALAASGNTFEKSVALLTAANATVQDIAKASTGLRTITARLRNTTVDLKELGEDMTKSKYEDLVRTMTKAGVELRDAATGEYRDTYDIFADLAAKWNELTSMEQSALANGIAGTRMQNVFFSLIQNFREASGAMDKMSESAGTLQSSYDIWLGTTEGKLSQLNTAFQQFSQSMLKSSTSNFFIGLAQGALQFATALSRVHALLPLIIAGFTLWKGLQGAREFQSLTSKILLQRAATEQDIVAVQGLSAAQRQLLLSQIELAVNTRQFTPEQAKQLVTQLGLNAAESSGIGVTNGLNVSLKALWTTIKANPIGLIITALATVISIFQIIQDNAARTRDELIQQNNDIISSTQEVVSQTNELLIATKAIESYLEATALTSDQEQAFATAIDTASKALGGKKITLNDTADKQREYLELLKQTSEEERNAALIEARKSRQAAENNVTKVANKDLESSPVIEYERIRDEASNAAKVFREVFDEERLRVYSASADSNGTYYDWNHGEFFSKTDILYYLMPEKNDAQSILDFYEKLVEVQDRLAAQDDTGGTIYARVTQRINQLKEVVEAMRAQDASLFLLENPVPDTVKTQDEYEAYIDTALASYDKLKGASTEYLDSVKELLYEYGTSLPDGIRNVVSSQEDEVKAAEMVIQAYKNTVAAMEQLSVKASETKFGNIDTDNRQVLYWSEANIAKYKEALKSWEISTSEIAGNISTLLGMSSEFDGVEIAFSPMLQTEDGAVLLDKNTVYKYIESLIKAAGEGWNSEDLLKLDVKGLEINGKQIKGLLADIGKSAIRTGQVMHFTGKDGALAQDTRELKKLAEEYGMTIEELLKKFDEKDVQTPAARLAEDLKALSSELSNMRSAYSTVGSAIQEYYKNGSLSSDTLSKLIALEPQYLNLLVDENGLLNLNSASYEKLVKAKMRDMLLNQMESAFNTVLSLNAEEAAAYAAAEAYDTETASIYGLILAKARIAQAEAYEKDRENKTDAYSKAITRVVESYKPLIAAVDNYKLSTDEANGSTDKATKALNEQKDALEKSKKALEKYRTELSDAQSDIKALIDLVMDYIKQQKEDEKEVLEERKKNFDDMIDKEKEELKIKKEAEEFDRKLRDKQSSHAKNQLAYSIATLDDSAAGRKAQKSAHDALIKSQDELHELLADHEYDIKVQVLDKLKEQSDKNFDEQIEKIEDYLQDVRAIYEDACKLIENDTGDLYSKLWNYTYKYTTKTRTEFDDMWSKAKSALEKYGVAQLGVIGVMEFLQGAINDTKRQVDNLSTAIDNVSDSIKNLADNALKQVSSSIGNVREEYEKLLAAMNVPPPSQDAQSSYTTFYGGYRYKYRGINFSSTKSNREEAIADIIAQLRKKFGSSVDVSPVKFEIQKYASGTLSARGGLSEVNEQGHEIRILNKGDGILTAKITRNLSALGENPAQFLAEAGKKLLSKLLGTHSNSFFAESNYNAPIAPETSIVIQGDATQSTADALVAATDRIVERVTRNVMNIAVRRKKTI